MRRGRATGIAAGVGLLLAGLVAGPATASWSSASTGNGRATAHVLPAVGGPVSADCAGGSTVRVAWSASTLATGYDVQRSADLGISWTTVRSTAGTSFDDTAAGLLNVTLRWRVVATRNAWRAAPSPASPSRTISGIGLCL